MIRSYLVNVSTTPVTASGTAEQGLLRRLGPKGQRSESQNGSHPRGIIEVVEDIIDVFEGLFARDVLLGSRARAIEGTSGLAPSDLSASWKHPLSTPQPCRGPGLGQKWKGVVHKNDFFQC